MFFYYVIEISDDGARTVQLDELFEVFPSNLLRFAKACMWKQR